MKKFRIAFRGTKTVEDLKSNKLSANESGEWFKDIESDAPPAVWHFTDFTYPHCGMTIHHFLHVPGSPGHFVGFQNENAKGVYSPKGRYLARYDIEITCRRFAYVDVDVGNFGLKPFIE